MENSTSSEEAFTGTEDEFPRPCNFSTSNNVKRHLSIYIYSIFCILGLVGNITVILTLTLKQKNTTEVKKGKEVYQLNLAITNLLFTVALVFLISIELFSWPMGQVFCKLLHGSYSINLYSGMLLITAMSIEHNVVVTNPIKAKTSSILKYHSIISVFIWVFAILVSVPTFYFYQWYELKTGNIYLPESEIENETLAAPLYICEFWFEDSEVSRTVKLGVPSTQMVVGFFLPLLIIVSSYTSIIVTLWNKNMCNHTKSKSHNKENHGEPDISSKNSNTNEDKAVKRVTEIMLVFVVCHLPYNLILLYDIINMFQQISCEEANILQTALSITESIAYLQCCLNPVVYGFRAKNFREKFRNIFGPFKNIFGPFKNIFGPFNNENSINRGTYTPSVNYSTNQGSQVTLIVS